MKLLVVSVILSMTAPLAYSNTLCEKATDVSSQMGPIKNQDNLGFCYAFAGVSLLEQYACRLKSRSCQIKDQGGLSVADALAQNDVFHEGSLGSEDSRGRFMSSAHFREAGDTGALLERLSQKGVCASEAAPYPSEFFPEGSASRVWNKIADFYSSQRARPQSRDAACLAAAEVVQSLSPRLSAPDFVGLLSNMVEKISSADSASKYLEQVLVSRSCVNNRVEMPPYKVTKVRTTSFGGTSSQRELGESVLGQLQAGGAVELDIDAGKAFPEMNLGSGHWHAVTIVGNRMINGKCQLQVRNSWGEQWQKDHNDGWLDAEQLMGTAVGATWIDPKGV